MSENGIFVQNSKLLILFQTRKFNRDRYLTRKEICNGDTDLIFKQEFMYLFDFITLLILAVEITSPV